MFRAFLLFLAGVSCARAETGTFSLSEALEEALAHAPELQQSRAQAEVAALAARDARAALLPTLDFTSNHGISHSHPQISSTDPWDSSLALVLKEKLYDNGESWGEKRLAEIAARQAQLSFIRAREDLALALVTRYHEFSLSTFLVGVRERQVGLIDRQFKLLSEQYEQGLRPRRDFLRMKAERQRAQLELDAARSAAQKGELELTRVWGGSRDHKLLPQAAREEKLARLTPQAPPARWPLFEEDFELRQESLRIRSALARRKLWPELYLNAGASYGHAGYLGGSSSFGATSQSNLFAGLTLNYNLFDDGLRRRQHQAARLREEEALAKITQERLDLTSKWSVLELDLQRLGSDFELQRELLALERDTFAALERDYREGKVTFLDLTKGLENLLSAQSSFATSYFDLRSRRAQRAYYQGVLYDEIKASRF